jgi:hypothetical protein
MTRAEHYRKRAKQAEERAKECQDPQAKREYLDIATKMRELAAQAERLDWH